MHYRNFVILFLGAQETVKRSRVAFVLLMKSEKYI